MKAAEPTTAYEAFERSRRTPGLRRNGLPPVSSRKAVAFPWLTLLLVLAAAAVLRVAFTAGPLGSDDIVYAERAIDALNGTFSPATYHGATRYGVLKSPVHLSDFKGKTVVLAFFFKVRTRG